MVGVTDVRVTVGLSSDELRTLLPTLAKIRPELALELTEQYITQNIDQLRASDVFQIGKLLGSLPRGMDTESIQAVASAGAWEKGWVLRNSAAVGNLQTKGQGWFANVASETTPDKHYETTVRTEYRRLADWQCECPQWRERRNVCKHIVAVALKLSEQLNRRVSPQEIFEKVWGVL
jgi:uncharacterized Zn finger protein